MIRIRTLFKWVMILIVIVIFGFLGYSFLFGSSTSADEPSGLPDNGGFFQVPLSAPQQYSKASGDWKFTIISNHAYTLAGKVVGRHEYPAAMPDGIIPLDLAVVNGDLLSNDNLDYFTFTMGDRTLEYSYDVPTYAGLTEEYIDEHISNNHLVFLNPAIESGVKNVNNGDCLIIKGKLVDIRGESSASQYIVNTSTVRNDGYPAGCEIILVEFFQPVNCGI
ncbi:MAG: hypothetical protein M0Q92_03050 [Methanoregula sp.]|jgi:hypothetical protein|nr:hypothetical protein [Methanoregula sp.]